MTGIVGNSAPMTQLKSFIASAARMKWSVLIQGESGTGKELVARALHLHSQRCASPFIAVNCALLSESLLQSELFGHERGAFTGAFSQKKGKFEPAAGGTLFPGRGRRTFCSNSSEAASRAPGTRNRQSRRHTLDPDRYPIDRGDQSRPGVRSGGW